MGVMYFYLNAVPVKILDGTYRDWDVFSMEIELETKTEIKKKITG